MLYSTLVGFMTYYAILFVIGVLVNAMAIEGELITLAVVGFIGAFLVRHYSRFVYRLAMGAGIAVSICLIAIWVFLPMLAGSTNQWLILVAVLAGLVMYVSTRARIFRYYTRIRTAPPFGVEWFRWLFIVVM